MPSLILLGDTMLGRLVNDRLKEVDDAYVWGNTLPILKQADWRLANLECVLSDRGTPWDQTPKMFHFRSDLKNIACLQKAQINMLSCANNHVLDYGYDALEDMIHTLTDIHYDHVGVGLNAQTAQRMQSASVEGINVGVIACTDNEPQWKATSNHMGAHHIHINPNDPSYQDLLSQVSRDREDVDLLIVSIHWGGNWGREVPSEHQRLAHDLIDAGADIIFGHSPHILRGIEIYQSKPIMYSAGDFVDDYAIDAVERNDLGAIFKINIHAQGQPQSIDIYPTVIHNCQVNLASGDNQSLVVDRLIQQSALLRTDARKTDTGVQVLIDTDLR